MKYLNLHIVRLLLMALLVLPATTSCYDYDHTDIDDYAPEAKNLINVTVTVSASNIAMTRANSPLGGEDGDGREQGIDTRENYVTGVTLIFFQDAANTTTGINATDANAQSTTIDYAVYYPVSRDDTYIPYTGVHLPGEIYYTTGDKELDDNIDPKKKYHMLVVANANLTSDITAGTTTLAQVRDMVRSSVYSGSGIGINASGFVMSSEKDHVINFDYSTYDKTTNRRTFHLDNVHLERMAARIDFWAAYSNGYKTSDDNAAYTTPGYEYTVKKPDGTDSQDRFVLTSITPFNLNMGTTGNEYLFKRTNDTTNPYLADETITNWVTDPYTSGKNAASHPDWMVSTLTSVVSNLANTYNITMASQQANLLSIGNKDDIIIAYPRENTLRPNGDSPLYYYATGLAFEGYYYRKGSGTGEHRVYYHFIRHQGEQNDAYDAWTSDNIDNAKTTYCPTTTAMNFGIVRNNIYRISVNQVTDGGLLQLRIAVHDWRNVEHPIIYI